jgi:hypothetical protein
MRQEFVEKIRSTIDIALGGGMRSVPLCNNPDGKAPFRDETHRRHFFAACHRAFEKAQNQIILLLEQICNETDEDEKKRKELIVRKIADAIAVQMVQTHTHVMRRFCIHSIAPDIDIATLKKALTEANRLNTESRQTFALLADLTTFIHIADILRVDVRSAPKLSLIELKSGKVNDVLLTALKYYKPDSLALEQIAKDPKIVDQHRKQALRMMKQRIRLHRAEEVLEKEEGIDPGLGVPIRISGPMIMNQPFDETIDQVCDAARNTGQGAATVDWCFHIAAGYDADMRQAKSRAFACLNHALAAAAQDKPVCFDAIQQEVIEAVGSQRDDNFKLIDLFANNLHSIATRPFLFWQIKRGHLEDLISGNIRLLGVFDLQKFIWLARREGANLQFASRRETEEAKAKFQSINALTFGHRSITYPYGEMKAFFTTGLFGRIINEQMRPLQLIREMLIPTQDEIAGFTSWAKKHGGCA